MFSVYLTFTLLFLFQQTKRMIKKVIRILINVEIDGLKIDNFVIGGIFDCLLELYHL